MPDNQTVSHFSLGSALNLVQSAFKQVAADLVCQKAFRQLRTNSAALGLDTSWRYDERMHKALGLIGNFYGYVTKKYGKTLLATHPISTADRCYTQLGQHPDLRDKIKLSPMALTFVQLTHDIVEESREATKKRHLPFNEKAVFDAIVDAWSDAAERPMIRENLEWMTDQKDLKGAARIQAQYDKAFNDKGECIVDAGKQLLRFNDKFDQILSDQRERINFLEAQAKAKKNGTYFPSSTNELDDIGLSDTGLLDRLKKAEMKTYVLNFPDVPELDKERYLETLNYLREQAHAIPVTVLTLHHEPQVPGKQKPEPVIAQNNL